jgi:hypothetical protein
MSNSFHKETETIHPQANYTGSFRDWTFKRIFFNPPSRENSEKLWWKTIVST